MGSARLTDSAVLFYCRDFVESFLSRSTVSRHSDQQTPCLLFIKDIWRKSGTSR